MRNKYKNVPLINVKLFNKNDEMIGSIQNRRKMKVASFLQGKVFAKAVLVVKYEPPHDNSGTYYNKEDLKNILVAFTEKLNSDYLMR